MTSLSKFIVALEATGANVRVLGQDEQFVDINIESWSTHKGAYRLRDNTWIREGRLLEGEGQPLEERIAMVRDEMQAFKEFKQLHASIDRRVQFILDHTLVVTCTTTAMQRRETVFRVMFSTGVHMDVIEFSADCAARYARQYARNGVPTQVLLLGPWAELEGMDKAATNALAAKLMEAV